MRRKYGCPLDCGYCGDGYLSLQLGETKDNCPSDFCEDRNPCTDDSWKSEGGLVVGCVHAPKAGPCDDGDPCTAGDTCLDGLCQPGSGAPDCDDANPCTADSCDEAQGGCVHTFDAQVTCEQDANPCTTHACDQASGACAPQSTDGTCDDGDPCTLVDECDAGACVGHGTNTCDDGNDCTTDACVPQQGCFHQDKADTTPCECAPGTSGQCTEGACVCG